MVVKMLYNWDDMHIFSFAFPKKKKYKNKRKKAAATLFFLLFFFLFFFLGEAELMNNRC